LKNAASERVQDDHATVVAARRLLQQLQDEAFVLDTLNREESQGDTSLERTVKRLLNLTVQARALGIDSNLTKRARQCVAVGAGKQRKGGAGGFEVAKGAFANLVDFAGVRDPREWTGPGGPRAMLCHSKEPITECLTTFKPEYEQEALLNFRDIMICMGDMHAQNCRKAASQESVIALATNNIALRDEIFVQLMKQLTRNPRTNNPTLRSEALGWHLLELLCISCSPTDELAEFVRAHVAKEANIGSLDSFLAGSDGQNPRAEIEEVARRCREALDTFSELPQLRGQLWKKSPSKMRLSSYDKRYFMIKDMLIYWWKNQEDAEAPNASAADGGPNCKGLIDLKNTDIEVVADPKSTTIFSLKGKDGLWSSGSLVKVSTLREDRVYTFDAQGSDHPRETWMKYISMHMERACRLREHAAAANQFSRVGEGSGTPADNVFKVGAAIWYKGHCKELRDDQMLVYGMAGTVINVNEDGSRLVLKFDGLKFQMNCRVQEISSTKLPETLIDGWKVLETVWYCGASFQFPDSASLDYGAEGKVIGPSKMGDSDCVAVRFPGVARAVGLQPKEISRKPPQVTLAHGWKVKDEVYYQGPNNQFSKGGSLTTGTKGIVVGPHVDFNDKVYVRFPGLTFNVSCLADTDLARTPPE